MNTRISSRLCYGWLSVAMAAAVSLAGAPVSAGKPPPPPPPTPPPVTFTAIDIGGGWGTIAAMNEAGTIVGTADLPTVGSDGLPIVASTGFVLEPEDTDGNGKPDTWYRDVSPADGYNDLMKPLKGMSGLGLETTPGATSAWDINAGGTIVGVQMYTATGTGYDDYWEGTGDYEAVVLWVRGANGEYGEPVLLTKFCSDGRPTINDAGCVVGNASSYYVYVTEKGTTTFLGGYLSNLPFVIVPEDVDGDGELEWFKDSGVNDHYGSNALMYKMADHYYLDEAWSVTNDSCVIIHGTKIVRPDYNLLNPWFVDNSVPPDGRNDLTVPFPAGSWAGATSPNSHAAAGSAGGTAALIDLTAPVPTCKSLGMLPDSDGAVAYGVNDAAWAVGGSYIVRRITPTRGTEHFTYRVYTGFFWKGGQMSKFSTLLSNAAVSAPIPRLINNDGIVAGTATSTGGVTTMFVAIPSVSP